MKVLALVWAIGLSLAAIFIGSVLIAEGISNSHCNELHSTVVTPSPIPMPHYVNPN